MSGRGVLGCHGRNVTQWSVEAAKAASAPIVVQIKRRLVRAQVAIAHFLLHHCIVFAASPTVRGEDAPAGPRWRDHFSLYQYSCRMCYKFVPQLQRDARVWHPARKRGE